MHPACALQCVAATVKAGPGIKVERQEVRNGAETEWQTVVSLDAPAPATGQPATLQPDLGLRIVNGRIGVEPATVPTYLTAVGSLDFPPIAAGKCAEMAFPFPGAYTGDAVAAGWPQDLAAGLLGMMIYISRQNEATVRLCAHVATDPPSANYRATIVRTF